jgi:prephenate dehydrogenase
VAPSVPATVAICGGGLIGTSLALGLAGRGHRVRVMDRDPDVRTQLSELMRTSGLDQQVDVEEDWVTASSGAGIVIAAVPPPAIPAVLATAASVAAPSALLTDVAGVKSVVVRRVAESLGTVTDGTAVTIGRYVGGHPMAGSERSGPLAGDAGLFTGATWVLTPTERTDDDALAIAGDVARSLGARVLVLRPDEHDHIVGLVSHLPQLVASVLADVAAEAVGADREAVMAVAGPGFRDTTRIAASDPELWLDIVGSNREAILAAMRSYVGRLSDVLLAVEEGDMATLEAVLRRASSARQRLLPKGIAEPTSDLRVPLRDRPGEIARITGALGSAGINIEDLAMRHASAADRGSLLIRVRSSSVRRATEVLEAAEVEGVVVETASGPEGGR